MVSLKGLLQLLLKTRERQHLAIPCLSLSPYKK